MGCSEVHNSNAESNVSSKIEYPTPEVGEGTHIKISTTEGNFNVWTKKIGNNPSMKVLLLHGGPGVTHEISKILVNIYLMQVLNSIIMTSSEVIFLTNPTALIYGKLTDLLMK
jgi:hypothetical protein